MASVLPLNYFSSGLPPAGKIAGKSPWSTPNGTIFPNRHPCPPTLQSKYTRSIFEMKPSRRVVRLQPWGLPSSLTFVSTVLSPSFLLVATTSSFVSSFTSVSNVPSPENPRFFTTCNRGRSALQSALPRPAASDSYLNTFLLESPGISWSLNPRSLSSGKPRLLLPS